MKEKIHPSLIQHGVRLFALPQTANVKQASTLMAIEDVGCVLVMHKGKLVGVFTERDLIKRAVAKGINMDTTSLKEVMTANPVTIDPDKTASDAINLMESNQFRHLPVVRDSGEILAVLSIKDLYGHMHRQLEIGINQRESFIFGNAYGIAC